MSTPVTIGCGHFSRSDRIQKSCDFHRVRDRGIRVSARFFVVNYLPDNGLDHPRLGVITTRRFGSAVARNRARRVLRVAFTACRKYLNSPVDLVLVARHHLRGQKSPDVTRELFKQLNKLNLVAVDIPGTQDKGFNSK